MPTPVPGVHHVTAITADARTNYDFYTDTLGLRMVKRSVNQDDPTAYHLFYADERGSPGTSMTFFEWEDMAPGQVGAGQVGVTAFRVPEGAIDYWIDRFDERGVDRDLELVEGATPDGASDPWTAAVPEASAIRGFHGVALFVRNPEPTAELLTTMGYEQRATDGDRRRLVADGDLGAVVDLVRTDASGQQGSGTVHHVAFRTPTDEEQADWRDTLLDLGFQPSPVIDRKWFHSVYFRGGSEVADTGGVLFELATHEPGYDVDEPIEELGESLALPQRFESMRGNVKRALGPLPVDKD
ncbi:ring-cleaving dioxygenase [Halobacteriales archaeon QS_5_70_17]|nr:MAG: ring-cleaving dioxygenase [Halobacteriales archaeon QS_5_70_17]